MLRRVHERAFGVLALESEPLDRGWERAMNLSELPQFTIDEVRAAPEGAEAHLVGRFSHLHGVRNEGGWLYRVDRPSIVGQLLKLPLRVGERVRFVSPDPQFVAELRPEESFPWVDGYWQAYHVSMILAGRWEPRTFTAEPAHYFRLGGGTGWQPVGAPLPEGAEYLGVRAGAWDHEHCELCRAHIGGPGDPHGFVDPEGHWPCASCFRRYAVPRDLSFVVGE